MPYFKWLGTLPDGSVSSGCVFARTRECAAKKLALECVDSISLELTGSYKPLSFDRRARIVRHLGFLLQSGVAVPVALEAVAATADDLFVKDSLSDCAQAVYEGASLDQACAFHELLFDMHFCALISAGTQTGQLVESLHMLGDYYDFMASLKRSIFLSLFMPLMTLIFFLVVMALFLVFVVPRFESVFHSIGQEPSGFAQILFSCAHWMNSSGFVLFLVIFALAFVLVWKFFGQKKLQRWRDWVLFYFPGVSGFVRQASMVMFLQPCALLLKGKVPLVRAIEVSKVGVRNSFAREQIKSWVCDVTSGYTWAEALEKSRDILPVSDLISVVMIGQKSGTLAEVVSYISLLYTARFKVRLKVLSRGVQPVLLLILGLCIALFILALYIPLLSLSNTVV